MTGKYTLNHSNSIPDADRTFSTLNAAVPTPSRNSERIVESLMEVPNPSASVLPLAVSAHHRRSGPVVGCGEGIFHPTYFGEYSSDLDIGQLLPVVPVISRKNQSPLTCRLQNTETLNHNDQFSVSSRTSAAISSSLGRTSQSSMEALDPPSSAAPTTGSSPGQFTRPHHLSRPGPESSAGDRAFQAAIHGKYPYSFDVALPDAASTSRLQPAVPCVPASQILLYYQNVGGMNSSLAEYQLACSDACYDIYAFSETWLNNNTLSKQLFNDTYSVYRQDRSTLNSNKTSGGGVLLAIRSCFVSRLLKPPEDSTVEHLWVAISTLSGTIYICVIYVPPDRVNDHSLIEKHALSLDWIVSQMDARDSIVILGDFNLGTVSWLSDAHGFFFPDNSRSSFRPASLSLLDAYSTARLQQVNGVLNANNRLLDLCFVGEDLGQSCSVTHAPAPLVKNCRHHSPLLLTLAIDPEKRFQDHAETVFYNFHKGDFERMNNFLANVDWNATLDSGDANLAASTMCGIIFYAIDQFVPKKLRCKPAKPAWSNSDLKHLKKVKRAALRKHSKYHTDSTKANYVRANNEYRDLNASLYNAHQSHLQSRLKANPKEFWRYVNEQRKETGLPSNMTDGVTDANSVADIANMFRTQFSSVFSDEVLDAQEIAAATSNVPRTSVFGSPFTIHSDMVISAGKQMKTSTGSGPDGIPSLVLKRCLDTLSEPLAKVFNLSMTSGVFPECWKDSFVFPVHKKGCKQTVANYRGIAALSAISKLFELIVLEKLVQDCSYSISQDQHGFMPKRSTTTNLTVFTSFIIREIERGHQVDAIYTDLSAAFDRVNHEITISKYDKMGVHGSLLTWLRSYLTGRSMSVKIGDYASPPFIVTSGVPQGSHLGPLLFLLYMNDVNLILKCLKLSYADDMKLYYVIKGPQDAHFLHQELEVFDDWCRINRMSLNVSKCSVISFGRKRAMHFHDYTLRGISLKRESTVKDLGVMLDCKLTFKDHIAYVVSKASSQLGFLFRFAKSFKDVYCLKALYCSLVRPILEYSAVVWSPFYQNAIHRIEAVQRKFIRFALRHLRWRDPRNLPSYESRCNLIDLELLEGRRNVAKACFVADLLQGNVDCSTLLSLLDINTQRRDLRLHAFFNNRRSRTNYGVHEPMLSMCRVFNSCYYVFDFNVSREKNKRSFKRCLR